MVAHIQAAEVPIAVPIIWINFMSPILKWMVRMMVFIADLTVFSG